MTDAPRNFATLADWLRHATAQRGAQRALAKAAGVSPQAVQKWLNGGEIKSVETLKRIAAWAEVPYAELRDLADGIAHMGETTYRIPAEPTAADVVARWQALPYEARIYVLAFMEALAAAPATTIAKLPPLPTKTPGRNRQ